MGQLLYDDFWRVDPDFDDGALDIALIAQAIERYGAVALHPDGSRSNVNVVPLCSHVPDGIKPFSEFFNKRRWLKQRVRDVRENQRTAAKAERQRRWRNRAALPLFVADDPPPKLHQYKALDLVPPTFPDDPPPAPRPKPPAELMSAMRLDVPIERGSGRVWRDYVMMRECDIHKRALHWTEIWRGDGLVLFLAEGSTWMWTE